MLELVFVRHGETDANARSVYMGWWDEELNEKGRMDAERAAGKLKNEQFDAVYSSPLKRALQSAEIICRDRTIPAENRTLRIQVEGDLRERNFGIWENLSYSQIREKYPEEHDRWVSDWVEYRIAEGESARDMYERAAGFLERLVRTHLHGKILLVTHKGFITNAAAYLLGLKAEDVWRFHMGHGSITRVEIQDGYGVLTMLNG